MIVMGLVSLGSLIAAEIAGVVWVRGLTLQQCAASFVTGSSVMVMLLHFVAMATRIMLVAASDGWNRWIEGPAQDFQMRQMEGANAQISRKWVVA